MKSTKSEALDRLVLLLKPKLKRLGFKKRGLTWSVPGKDCTLIINIQKSAYGPGAYLNAGLFLHMIHPDANSRKIYYKSDIYFRINNMISHHNQELEMLVRMLEQGEAPSDGSCDQLCNGLMEVIEDLLNLLDLRALRLRLEQLAEYSLIDPKVRKIVSECP